MIASTSLSAFSALSTPSVGAPSRTGAPPPVQPVRAQQAEPAARQTAPSIPDARPSLPPPRGTLLNLSV